jgi:hypothetical protein
LMVCRTTCRFVWKESGVAQIPGSCERAHPFNTDTGGSAATFFVNMPAAPSQVQCVILSTTLFTWRKPRSYHVHVHTPHRFVCMLAGGRGPDGAIHEGLFFHFMCSKWSAAFGANFTDNKLTAISYGEKHIPLRLRQQCRMRGGGRWHEMRWNLTFSADASAVAFNGGLQESRPPVLLRNNRNVPDTALLTFHDPLWGTRPLRGCDVDTPAAPAYNIPARNMTRRVNV